MRIFQHLPANTHAHGAAEKVWSWVGQGVAMKIGLEARLTCKVESDLKIMEWITGLASERPLSG